MAGPAWNDPIKAFFRPWDIESMEPMGINLGDYASVKEHATAVLERLRDGSMPCDGAWPPERVDTFEQWVTNGMPESEAIIAIRRTFYDDVLPLFTDMDIECMAARPTPVLLASYDWWLVTSGDSFMNYDRVLSVVKSGFMPLGGPQWDQVSIDVLVAWKDGGFLRGAEPVDPPEETV